MQYFEKMDVKKVRTRVLFYLFKVQSADMNEIQENCHLSEEERTFVEYLLARGTVPPLIKKIRVLGVTKPGINPYTLTVEGMNEARSLISWYKKIESWGVILTAVFTGIMAAMQFI